MRPLERIMYYVLAKPARGRLEPVRQLVGLQLSKLSYADAMEVFFGALNKVRRHFWMNHVALVAAALETPGPRVVEYVRALCAMVTHGDHTGRTATLDEACATCRTKARSIKLSAKQVERYAWDGRTVLLAYLFDALNPEA